MKKETKETKQKCKENEIELEPIDTMAEFIAQIIKAREAKSLSQSEFAQICGLKQSAVSRMENLKSNPQLDTILKILTPLGLKLKLTRTNQNHNENE